jgi:hypothetical protein
MRNTCEVKLTIFIPQNINVEIKYDTLNYAYYIVINVCFAVYNMSLR